MPAQAGEVTQFRGILPPGGPGRTRSHALPPNRTTPAGVILHALHPLCGELDAALARNDRPAALRLAYTALGQVADALAAYRGDRLLPGQIRIHALLVELEPLPLELNADGTLAERGTAVSVSYRNWAVKRHEAAVWAQTLSQHFKTMWPGAWVLVTPEEAAQAPTVSGAQP